MKVNEEGLRGLYYGVDMSCSSGPFTRLICQEIDDIRCKLVQLEEGMEIVKGSNGIWCEMDVYDLGEDGARFENAFGQSEVVGPGESRRIELCGFTFEAKGTNQPGVLFNGVPPIDHLWRAQGPL